MFSGFDTTRFQIFLFYIFVCLSRFIVSSRYHIIESSQISHITLLALKKGTIENIEMLKDTECQFNGFDTSFFKSLIEFFNFVVNCRFYFVV